MQILLEVVLAGPRNALSLLVMRRVVPARVQKIGEVVRDVHVVNRRLEQDGQTGGVARRDPAGPNAEELADPVRQGRVSRQVEA